jgi:hypothetical protein
MPPLIPYLTLGFVVCCLVAVAIQSQWASLKLTRRGWDELVAGLLRLDSANLTVVAKDFLDPHRGQIGLQPPEMWELVGGYEGLKKMKANAQLMLALAAYTQQWNYEESVIVSERMRRDALRLVRSVRRVQIGMLPTLLLHRHLTSVPFHIHEAASAYYLMRQRLLALYETSHAGLYPRLSAAL